MAEQAAAPQTDHGTDGRIRLLRRAVETWKGQLVDVGGRNTLLYYRDLKQGTLDLSADGVSVAAVHRLLAAETVRLSDLFPAAPADAEASGAGTRLGAAAKRARTIRAKATENLEERGIQTLFLAWGMTTWTNQIGAATPAAPMLLVEAALSPRGLAAEDFDVSVIGDVEVNPTLVHFLASEFSVDVDADELLDLLTDDHIGAPDPTALFDRLRKKAADIPGFDVTARVVLGNFSYAKLPMVKDLDAALDGGLLATNPLVAAIAGDAAAEAEIRQRHPSVSLDEPDLVAPRNEFLVLDADASQSYAITAAARGGDLVVEGPPGTGKSQTIANMIATLAALGKRTLFVAEKRAAIDAVLDRLTGAGLGDLVLDLHDGVSSRKQVAQQLAKALSAAEAIALRDHADSHDRLSRRRDALRQMRDAMHRPRQPWDISVYEIQSELLGLRASAHVATRFARDVILTLGRDEYRSAAVDLDEFADLGGLALITSASPWRPAFERALITSADQVEAARNAIARLARETLPRTRGWLCDAAARSGLGCPALLSGWDTVVTLLEDVARVSATHDPAIFAEAESLVAGLEPATHGVLGRVTASISDGDYRRARKRMAELAGGRKESPPEMRAAAEAALDVSRRWAALSVDGGSPRIAVDASAARGMLTQLADEVRAVAQRVGLAGETLDSADVLGSTLEALLAEQPTAVRLPELHRLSVALGNRQLWPFIVEIAQRGFDAAQATCAFRLAWLESILDHVELSDPVIGGFDRATHDRAVAEFQDADRAHLRRTPERVRRAVAENLVRRREEHPQQSQLIRAEASKKQRHLPLRMLVQQAPDVLTALKPCWAMSPLVVAQMLPAQQLFDVVIFDEASQVMPADAIGALMRARTAIVAGDSKQLPPTSFFAASSGGGEDDEAAEEEMINAADSGVALTKDIESVLEVMRALLPPPVGTKTLNWHYRSRDERLIAFSNAQESLYDWSLTTFPGTGVDNCIVHELIPWEPGRVGQEDSVSAEVQRVVELVVEHVRQRPHESVGVIAMGIKHANRIQEGLRQVRLADPDLGQLIDSGPPGRSRPEPVFVKNLERVQGDERDAIILTIGYGKNADGRMMYRFGPLNQEGGERRLNVAITRARSRMTVVSSFGSGDLDPNKLRAEGARMLCRYLQYAESRGQNLGDQAKPKPALNPFERDVRDALTASGVPLVAQYGCSGYWIDFAAQHPTQPGRMVLAIEADGATYHAGQTARDRDRLRQEHLERLGWRFHRIWSTDWFHRRSTEIQRAVEAWNAAVREADEPVAAPEPPRWAPPDPAQGQATVLPTRTLPRPRFVPGLPINQYDPQTLRALAAWIESDTLLRTQDEVVGEMMVELGFKRRGKNVVAALEAAVIAARR